MVEWRQDEFLFLHFSFLFLHFIFVHMGGLVHRQILLDPGAEICLLAARTAGGRKAPAIGTIRRNHSSAPAWFRSSSLFRFLSMCFCHFPDVCRRDAFSCSGIACERFISLNMGIQITADN